VADSKVPVVPAVNRWKDNGSDSEEEASPTMLGVNALSLFGNLSSSSSEDEGDDDKE
jgi:hypothetical protein